jgi:DNA-binding Lrp family transcriptional regulator
MSERNICLSALSEVDKRLLNDFQRGLPLSPAPYAEIAEQIGVSEKIVLDRLESLRRSGAVSRVGPVFQPARVGASTLAAMSVPEDRLTDVAALVNQYEEINHNYEREHDINLWFVVTAESECRVHEVVKDIERRTGLDVLDLPMLNSYHIELGFSLW